MTSEEYWRKREENQRKKNITDEAAYNKEIQQIYASMMDNIQKEINSFYTKYASKEGITMAEAKKRVSQLDIEAYSRKAKKYVKNRDFSDEANEEMRLYNLTMKVNRLEMLKANIGLELVDGFDELEKFFDQKLTDRTLDEFQRQAGILGKSIQNNQKFAHAIVNASFHNATFSERIWMHQNNLKAELEKQLSIGLIQGRNPRVLARNIQKKFNTSKEDAERLMITELCRVQTGAQKQSYVRNEYEEYTFLAESTACGICADLDGKHFKVKDMQPGKNAPPMHPHCRCSTSAYMDREAFERYLDEENRKMRERMKETGALRSKGNDSSAIPKHDKPVLLGKVDFSDYDVVLSKLKEYESEIGNSSIENAVVICRDGDIVQCFGALNGVYPDADLGEKIMGAAITHNHPAESDNEYSFSNSDVQMFIDYELEVLRGIDEKYIYELTRNAKEVDEHMTLEELMMTDGDCARHETVIDIALKYGFGYRRWER